jgi:hypothetical protein
MLVIGRDDAAVLVNKAPFNKLYLFVADTGGNTTVTITADEALDLAAVLAYWAQKGTLT